MKEAVAGSPWLTLAEFMERNRFDEKKKTHIMFLARCKRIPGAKKIAGHWRFHREMSDKWDETGMGG